MVVKRSLYLLVAVWLISSIVCLHANKVATPLSSPVQHTGIYNEDGSEIATDYNHVILDTDDHSNSDNNSRPTKRAPRKILPRRIAEINAQLPFILDFVKGNVAVDIHHTYGTLWFNKAFLPGYYNFLFRYKPF